VNRKKNTRKSKSWAEKRRTPREQIRTTMWRIASREPQVNKYASRDNREERKPRE